MRIFGASEGSGCLGLSRLGKAEGVGFEPTEAFTSPVFKTGAINHSTTPPGTTLGLSHCFMGPRNRLVSSARSLRRVGMVGLERSDRVVA